MPCVVNFLYKTCSLYIYIMYIMNLNESESKWKFNLKVKCEILFERETRKKTVEKNNKMC